ncbi:oligosaccharide flippase family protein [Geomonas subterranea]|uniref:Oligosaccharide flippase family protein n=1 Tax=Geomonas subterranea TaxID=2847989 RepID=A0ABX8LM27_9BACT|nr:oligosaccharide flippase family protein [Geomonas subterranea]QXM11320.1 oligosaccharide flippase family protein [Geomonas subterranea]
MTKVASLQKRFAFKLGANVFGILLGLVTMSFVPRVLGPEQFGKFEFITNNFKLIFDTLALQVPVAYFNWVSRKGHKEDTDLATGATFYFSLAIATLFALFLAVSHAFGLHAWLWPDVAPEYLWAALAFTMVTFLYQFLVYLSDGKSLTVGLEQIRLVQNTLKFAVLALLAGGGLLTLGSYLWAQVAVVAATVALSVRWLYRQDAWRLAAIRPWRFPKEEIQSYGAFVWDYARPLTLLMLGGFLFLYFDRWFLQLIGGSMQQGFFGLSDRLGQIAFLFTSAMTPLLTREFALAHEEKDHARLLILFERIKLFLFIATVASCFLSVQSGNIVALIGGEKYKGAIIPIALMALYPIHQTFGQLSGALMVATGQTALYARLGIIMMVVSLPITYFCIAPVSFAVPGLALGATGLALKMLTWQFVGTNVQLFCNTRYLRTPFAKWLGLQVMMVAVIYGIAYTSHLVSGYFNLTWLLPLLQYPAVSENLILHSCRLISAGLVYLIAIAGLIWMVPGFAGITRKDIMVNPLSLLRK